MLSNWTEENNKEFINLKLTSVPWPCEKHEAPKFVVLWNDFQPTEEKYSELSGKLIKIRSSFTPAKWRMWNIFWFKAFFDWWDKVAVVESTITNASKDLLNSLIPNIGKELKISLYLNKNWYPTSSVKDWQWQFVETAMPFNSINTETLFNLIKEKEQVWITMEDNPF